MNADKNENSRNSRAGPFSKGNAARFNPTPPANVRLRANTVFAQAAVWPGEKVGGTMLVFDGLRLYNRCEQEGLWVSLFGLPAAFWESCLL